MKDQNELRRIRRLNFRVSARDYLGGKCVVCGVTDGLDFDHINPATKLFNVSWGVGNKTIQEVWSEIDKCQLLCATHHDEKTKIDGSRLEIRGEGHGRSKLRTLDIKYIYELSSLGYTQRGIAKEFNVSHVTIGQILRGELWTHISR